MRKISPRRSIRTRWTWPIHGRRTRVSHTNHFQRNAKIADAFPLRRSAVRARALIFYGTTQFMVRFLPKFACYTAARSVPAMRTALVSTWRSRLSVIASRKAGGNFCKWSHSLSTTGAPGMRRSRDFYSPCRGNSLKPMIRHPSRLPRGMFRNNLIWDTHSAARLGTIVPRRCLNMKCRHETYMRASRANGGRKKRNEVHPASFFAGIRCRRSAIGVSIAKVHTMRTFTRAHVHVCAIDSTRYFGKAIPARTVSVRIFRGRIPATFISRRFPPP